LLFFFYPQLNLSKNRKLGKSSQGNECTRARTELEGTSEESGKFYIHTGTGIGIGIGIGMYIYLPSSFYATGQRALALLATDEDNSSSLGISPPESVRA